VAVLLIKDKESGQWRINTSNVPDDALPDSRNLIIQNIENDNVEPFFWLY